jgi:DNA repair protein RecN (Recombination protein N)
VIIDITITDLGVISEARLPLGPGLTVVTGETGAGKTMVVTALGLLLGARSDATRVRQGSAATWVEGRFSIAGQPEVTERATELGASFDEGELVLAREVQSEGRSRAIVGGRSAPVSALAELGEQLVVIHGQSDQIRLKSETAQRDALDRFAGAELAAILGEYQQVFHGLVELRTKRDMLRTQSDARAREAEEVRLALSEIEALSPNPGEDTALSETVSRLTNQEDLRQAASIAKQALTAEESSLDPLDALSLVDTALKALDRVVGFDPSVEPLRAQLADASYQLSETAGQLASYLSGLEGDGGLSLESTHERLAAITALMRRYGPTLDDVLEYQRSGSDRLFELDRDTEALGTLDEDVNAAETKARSLSTRLSELRTSAGKSLGAAVTRELAALAMPTASLHAGVTTEEALSAHGCDQVQLLLAAHPGATPVALGKGASGGELSRVMLALEVVIAGSDPVPTFVFDEVDAGVGGASALEIGRRLDALSQTSQVIVVTHLAQVAAFANNHLRVVKDTKGEVTTSSVAVLTGEDRVRELARMLGGMEDSQTALSHARELIETTHSVSRR